MELLLRFCKLCNGQWLVSIAGRRGTARSDERAIDGGSINSIAACPRCGGGGALGAGSHVLLLSVLFSRPCTAREQVKVVFQPRRRKILSVGSALARRTGSRIRIRIQRAVQGRPCRSFPRGFGGNALIGAHHTTARVADAAGYTSIKRLLVQRVLLHKVVSWAKWAVLLVPGAALEHDAVF